MNAIKSILFTVLLFISLTSFGQSKAYDFSGKKYGEIKQIAKRADYDGDYYLAIEGYKEVLRLKPDQLAIEERLAFLSFEIRDYESALNLYEKIEKQKPNDAEVIYAITRLYLHVGKYETARSYIERFKRKFSNDPLTLSEYQGKLYLLDQSAKQAIRDTSHLEDYVIWQLDTAINYPHSESSPVTIDNNNLFFASVRSRKASFDDKTDLPSRKIYHAYRNEGEGWQVGQTGFPFLDAREDVGNLAFSPDSTYIFFTQCVYDNFGKSVCGIYWTHRNGDQWLNAEPLGKKINLSEYTNTQPTVSQDLEGNLYLYFVSNRPEGYGGTDIWYCVYSIERDAFSVPKNAGGIINTSKDETTPWYSANQGKLYFSSEGHPGFGGQDVFVSKGQKYTWNLPDNLGKNINTGADENYYSQVPNGEGGYFSSNRATENSLIAKTCCDDIYQFKYAEFIDIRGSGCIKLDSMGVISDITPPFRIELYAGEGDSLQFLTKLVDEETWCYTFDLEVNKSYTVMAFKDGYLKAATSLNTNGIKESKLIKINDLVLKKETFDAFVLPEVFYPFDSAELTDRARDTLDLHLYPFLIANPDIIIELSSHTDSKGSDDYNVDLSHRRAKSVVDYMVKLGIEKDRMVPKGSGEFNPRVPNTNPDGSDNPENRAINRRTEVRVLGKKKRDAKFGEESFEEIE